MQGQTPAHTATPSPRQVSRRSFAGLVGASSLTLATAGAGQAASEKPFRAGGSGKPQSKPNILFIMADDLGWADLSSYGAPHISTPNLDQLAKEGIRFTNGYAGSATCSPTRLSLYTGRYPGRLQAGLSEPIIAIDPSQGLPPEHPTLASLLRANGYGTALFGKWHCGHLPWFSPLKSGWDEWLGNLSGGMDYFSKIGGGNRYDLFENDVEYQDLRYYTDILTERTVEFITRTHEKPWLINLNYTTPHWPWEGPGDQKVSGELTARAKAGERGVLSHRDGGSVEKYKEMVENLDASIGKVLEALRRKGQHQNTIVIFKSDNGGERFSYQWPLRGKKEELLEGGIRVPTIVRWPAVLPSGKVSDLPVSTMDWTRTLLSAADTEPDPRYPMDGRDLGEYLWGTGEVPKGDLFWRVLNQGALRRGDWKYLVSKDVSKNTSTEKLYNLQADQREEADLSKKEPVLLMQLRNAWNETNKTLLEYPAARVQGE